MSEHVLRELQHVAGLALRPGGHFAGEFGASGNVATVSAAVAEALSRRGLRFADFDPWYYPTAAEYRQALEGAGFSVDTIETFARRTRLRFHATKPAVGARP